ncbi:MAG: AMP-binding protein [Gammaproteobacteria bacterium]|nr:AMP-binding protein [Gammaproteobacteria bacterium]
MDDILALLERAAPNATAIRDVHGNGTTYAQMCRLAQDCGDSLVRVGVGATDRVAIVMPNGPLMAMSFVCCAPWCAVAPLNPAYTADEFEFYLGDLAAKVMLVEANVATPAVAVARRMGVEIVEINPKETHEFFKFGIGTKLRQPRELDAVALILHTSGTTSRPKMVPLSQRNLLASARNIATTLQLTAADRCLNVMPLFHIHGLMAAIMATIHAGSHVCCSPGFDALRFFSWLDATEPTWYSAVPTMHQAILARSPRNESSLKNSRLRFIRSSSASLPVQVLTGLEEAFDTPMIEAYAMTEAAHQMCSNPLPPRARKPGYVGLAAGPEVRIARLDQMEFVEPDVEGEIVIRGENVTQGYVNNPEANAKDFQDGWFRTGDLGIMDADGYVKVTGRLKEIINRGGEKIAPLEVDEVLLDHPTVAQVCTFAVPHSKLGEDVAAIVVAVDGETAHKEEIQRYARQRLAPFKVPREIVFANEIPKGPTGKVQRIGMAERLGLTD